MQTIERSIDIDVPVRTAYDQWTQFETFPEFMEAVTDVTQLDDQTLHWKVDVAGVEREFAATITEQTPDQRIAWSTVSGPHQGGVVTFHELSDETTRVMYQMDFDPEGVAETIGAATGVVERQVAGDLDRFKGFIESRNEPTGAWRGAID